MNVRPLLWFSAPIACEHERQQRVATSQWTAAASAGGSTRTMTGQ
jgi:hypothetical protein